MPKIDSNLRKKFDTLKKQVTDYKLPRWLVNLHFAAGNQWVEYHRRYGHIVPMTEYSGSPDMKYRITRNLIFNTIDAAVSIFTQKEPKFSVIPIPGNTDSREQAALAEMVLRYIFQSSDSNILLKCLYDALFYACVAQVGFIKVYFDKDAGNIVAAPYIKDPEGNKIYDIDPTSPYIQGVDYFYEGEVRIKAVSPFRLYFVARDDFEDIREVFEISTMDRGEINRRYGIKDIPEQQERGDIFYIDAEISRVALQNSEGLTLGPDEIVVAEYYRKPDLPYGDKGKYVKFIPATGEILEESDGYPFEHGQLPYIPVHLKRFPGNAYGKAIVEDLIGVQILYNRMFSGLSKHANMMGSHKYLTPRDYVMNPEGLTSDMQVVYYEKNKGPANAMFRVLEAPTLPAPLKEMLMLSREELRDAAGTPKEVLGQVSPYMAAKVLDVALSQALGPFMVPATILERNLAKLAKMALSLANQYFDPGRILRITGDRGDILEEVEFRRLSFDNLGRLIVRIDPNYQLMKTYKQQLVKELAVAGLFMNKKPEEILRMIDTGIYEDTYTEEMIDEVSEKQEIKLMLKGQPVEVLPFEDHEVRIRVLTNFMKSLDYKLKYAQNPQINQIFTQHLQAHQQYYQQQLERVQQMQMAAAQQAGMRNASKQDVQDIDNKGKLL